MRTGSSQLILPGLLSELDMTNKPIKYFAINLEAFGMTRQAGFNMEKKPQ